MCVTDRVIALSDGNKSPGLDGFNFSFFERFWPLLKEDIGVMLNRFHKFTYLPRSCSSFFVTLIPKVDSPSHLGDFIHISLVGSLYKILAKVFVATLSGVMDKLISPTYLAFLKGGFLVYGVVVV